MKLLKLIVKQKFQQIFINFCNCIFFHLYLLKNMEMKLKLRVKYHNKNCKFESFGNWIDLKSAENVELKRNEFKLISLGFSCKLPKYFQANIVPRSSTFIKYNITQHNHYGVIDGPDKTSDGYSGNNDIWKFGAIAHKKTQIKEGDRICQFEIRPQMNAPFWAKLKWLFCSGIKIIEVADLKSNNRGGFGSSENEALKSKKPNKTFIDNNFTINDETLKAFNNLVNNKK